MVAIEAVQKSNKLISNTFPEGLVAVFVGATSGIGEYSLLELSRCAPAGSRIYFIGRSKDAGARIRSECEKLSPQSTFEFISSDVSLMKNVDAICRQIKSKESYINLLFQTQGNVVGNTVTSEGIVMNSALVIYSRNRFTVNLLPLLNAAPSLRRVVTVAAGTTEGGVDLGNLDGLNLSLLKKRAQQISMVTLSMEVLAQQNPTVSFIHDYPGPVQSNVFRDLKGPILTPMRYTLHFLYRFYNISVQETGERHVFLATSLRWPPKEGDGTKGVAVAKDVGVARGVDGVAGSGCYCVTQPCDEGSDKQFALLKAFREDGTRDKVWEHIQNKFVKVTGTASM